MIARARPAVAAIGLLLLAWLAWTVVQATRADALAASAPEAALRIEPGHPVALRVAARRALLARELPAATELAQRLLATDPGQGEGFATIALAAAEREAPDAGALMEIAARRAARNRQVRARLAALALGRGDLPEAMVQLDALLRLGAGANLYPALIRQSTDPAFAAALADTLARRPRWGSAFMATLLAQGSPAAVDHVYAELRRKGALSRKETSRWLGRMMKDGRWGEAYAYWVSTLGSSRRVLAPVFDGGFELDASGVGFDWQPGNRSQGVFTEFEEAPGATGRRAAHFRFIGPAADGDLRQPLLLAPGRYRLSLRARAEFLQTDRGLEWRITCHAGPVIAALGPLEGSFDWRRMQVDFSVPAANCPGQWLELRNPAPAGAAQHASGDLWTDDVAVVPLD
jgi:hypothetical protein